MKTDDNEQRKTVCNKNTKTLIKFYSCRKYVCGRKRNLLNIKAKKKKWNHKIKGSERKGQSNDIKYSYLVTVKDTQRHLGIKENNP